MINIRRFDLDQNELLTVDEARQYLKVGRNKMYRIINLNDFPKLIIGSSIRIPKIEFEEWIGHYYYKKCDI